MILLFAPLSRAQVPVAAGYSPSWQATAGYSYVNLGVPGRPRLNLHGGEAGVTVDFNARLGIELDVSYTRAPDVYGSRHVVDLATYMAGPVVYARRGKRLDVYVHGLMGAARETGVNYDSNGDLLRGFVTKFAWAAGGGAEYKIDRKLFARLGCDYVNTATFDSKQAIRREDNIRAFVGFTYRFGGRRP